MNRKSLALIFIIFICSICCCIIGAIAIPKILRVNDYKVAVYGDRVGDSEYYFVKKVDEYSSESLNIADDQGNMLIEEGLSIMSENDVVEYKIFDFPDRDVLVMTSYMWGRNSSGTWITLFQIDKNGFKKIVYTDSDWDAWACGYPEIYEDKIILLKIDDSCETFFGIADDMYYAEYEI